MGSTQQAYDLLKRALSNGSLTGRGVTRVRRVAQTIAALAEAELVTDDHVAEAMGLRGTW
jgi:predicted ATPase with chaperone activity